MGEAVHNAEVVTDYTPNKSFFRMHMDLPIPSDQIVRLRALLDSGDLEGAHKLISDANPELQCRDMLDSTFAYLKQLQQESEAPLKRTA